MNIKLTDAIGDTVIATALAAALNRKNIATTFISSSRTIGLWNKTGFDLREHVDGEKINLVNYLRHLPNSVHLPRHDRYGHLSEWMSYELEQKTEIKVDVKKEDVKIILSDNEISQAQDMLEHSKQSVIIAPYATSPNRSLSTNHIHELTKQISSFATPYILDPHNGTTNTSSARMIGHEDLRIDAAILYCATAIIAVDSGPFHLANAVIQGRGEQAKRVVLVAGSTRPDVVKYKGNKVVAGYCELGVPCGFHGYAPAASYKQQFNREFTIINGKNISGCISPNYAQKQEAPCMNISIKNIVEQVRKILS